MAVNATVSVIIPAYKAAAFIDRAIRSALQQEHVAEVIIVDDVSPDNTCEVVEALVHKDARVRLVRRTTNGGPSAARNDAIRLATSEWIATLDADDAYAPNRFEGLLRLAQEHDADLVSDNLIYYDGTAQQPLGPSVHPEPRIQTITLEKLFRSTPTGGKDYVTLLPICRRAFLINNDLLYDERIRNGEDFDLVARCLVAGGKFIADLGQGTYLYTTRQSGTSQTLLDDRPVIRQAEAWLDHPEFRDRPERVRLVRDRLRILRRRQLDRIAGRGSAAHKLMLLPVGLRTGDGRRWLFDWVKAKLSK